MNVSREQLAANSLSNLDDFSIASQIANDSFMGNRTPQSSVSQTPNCGSERIVDIINTTPGSPSGCSTNGYFENYPLSVDSQESLTDLNVGIVSPFPITERSTSVISIAPPEQVAASVPDTSKPNFDEKIANSVPLSTANI